jgi:hypothetical protein
VIGIAYCLIIIRVSLIDRFKTNAVFFGAQVSSCQTATTSSKICPTDPAAVHLTQCMHTSVGASDASDSSGKTIPFRGA